MQKTLGLELADMTDDLRKRYKIKDSRQGRGHHRRRRRFGRGRQAAGRRRRHRRGRAGAGRRRRPTCRSASTQLKKDGKKTALLLVATAEGDMLFVALPIN